jgi:hypothetical protein
MDEGVFIIVALVIMLARPGAANSKRSSNSPASAMAVSSFAALSPGGDDANLAPSQQQRRASQ